MSHFCKRHYEAVAEAMQWAARAAKDCNEQTGVEIAVRELADAFAKDNSQFRRNRFILACVPGANVKARS